MRYRRLGRTGITVSEIGFGAWGIGGAMWRGGDDDDRPRRARRGARRGLHLRRHARSPTATATASGWSARAIARTAERIAVATKIPPANRIWPARAGVPLADAFPADHVRALRRARARRTSAARWTCCSSTCGRTPGSARAGGGRSSARWPRSSRPARCGTSASRSTTTSRDNGLEAVRRCDLVSVRAGDLQHLRPDAGAERLLPACVGRGTSASSRGCPSTRAGSPAPCVPGVTFPPGDWRNRYFGGDRPAAGRRARVARLRARRCCARTDILAEGALRFCLSHPAVSTVIPGMRTAAHARDNCAASDGRRLTPGLLAELKAHQWYRNFYE